MKKNVNNIKYEFRLRNALNAVEPQINELVKQKTDRNTMKGQGCLLSTPKRFNFSACYWFVYLHWNTAAESINHTGCPTFF